MIPQSESYLLLLHTLFFDHPLRMVETAKLFPTEEAFREGFEVLLRVSQTSAKRQEVLRARLNGFDLEAIQQTLQAHGIGLLFYHEEAYPECLRHISDPPLLLFYRGDIGLLKQTMLGVVGARSATEYGEKATATLVKGLLPYFTIVSGMAQGIDAVAHHTTLQFGGATVAVMGTGFDNPYPESNKGLFHTLTEKGLVLTEYPLGTVAMPYHFPQRNRIISGLCKGVLVVEAGEKSGAMITARMAIEQDREVFAVPGSIFSDTSAGTHVLIQDGAKLVYTAQDILSEFNQVERPALFEPQDCEPPKPVLNFQFKPEEKLIWDVLTHEPIGLEALLEKTQLPVQVVFPTLTLFEIKEMIEQLPGKFFKKR